LRDYIWMPGERDDIARVLAALDIYVCSSIAEGIALTILEAMASGLPIVATAVGGNPELVIDGETGMLVPVADTEALAGALAGLVADPARRRASGEAARARAQAMFSLESMVADYCRLYDQLLAETVDKRHVPVTGN
jgi:glycosyltransferase involved in cell wall biosynthesis